MELKEFITQTLVQITEGVAEAQTLVKESGCLINPEGFSMVGDQIKIGYKNEYRKIQNIKMSVSVTVTEGTGNKSGIGIVASVFKVGMSADQKESNEVTNRIDFEIPISLPVMEK
jgi:hypothetical protein